VASRQTASGDTRDRITFATIGGTTATPARVPEGHRRRRVDGFMVRSMGTDLLTVRIDLEPR
jgi:hypothetical protein